jgi:plastocyanin
MNKNNKNYLWIAIAVMVVIVALLLLVKGNGTKTNQTQNPVNSSENSYNNNSLDTGTGVVTEPVDTKTDTDVINIPLSKEATLEVTAKNFSPKNVKVQAGQKVFITLSAKDEAKHTFGFIDADLSFITMAFSKEQGNQSLTFPAPAVGTYTFYIDDKTNTGKLIVE